MSRFEERSPGLRNVEWRIPVSENGTFTQDAVRMAVLMDIREELQRLNALLRCPNFMEITSILRSIQRNTKPRAKAKPGKKEKK